MYFFTWGINKPGIGEKRKGLIEEHWAYMDRFDDRLISRGPTLDSNDISIATGSTHIVDLEDWDAAERFVYDEPFAANGLFEEIILTGFHHGLDRTQFEFESKPDWPRFFFYCRAKDGVLEKRAEIRGEHQAYLRLFDDRTVCRGGMLDRDGNWIGSLFYLEVASEDEARAFLDNEPYNRAGLFEKAEMHRWTMGGRRNLTASGTPVNS